MTAELSLDDLLLAHAAGRLAEPVALAVATHLALAPASRPRFRGYEILGGVLLEGIEPEPTEAGTWEAMLGRLRREDVADPVPAPLEPARADDPLPGPLRPYVPQGLEALRWRTYGPVAEALLDLGSRDYRASLFRLRAGRKVLRHTHGGNEITVVLDGAFHDKLGRYRRGDIAIADPSIDHQPTAEPDGDCLCFAVTDAPLRLTGPIGRFLNPLLRM